MCRLLLVAAFASLASMGSFSAFADEGAGGRIALVGDEQARGEQVLSLEAAIKLALQRNPELKELAADVEGARARAVGAEMLLSTNPELDTELGYRSPPDRERKPEYRVGVSQAIPIAGQRGARRGLTGAEHRAAVARLERRRSTLAADIRTAFARFIAAWERRKLADGAEQLARETLVAAEERFRTGAAPRMDVNTARAGIGRTARDRTVALQQQAAARVDLRLLIGLDPGVPIAITGDLMQLGAFDVMAEALAERARQSRPDLRAARLDVEAAKAAKSLAAREGVPDVRIGASYGKEEDANVVLGTLSVPIPLFQRNQAARGEAAARIARAEATLEGFERQVREEVQLAVQHYKSASAAAKVYAGEVLAALQDNAALVNEAYRAGKVNLFELAFMRRETLEAQRSYIDVLEELAEARSELERAVGATP